MCIVDYRITRFQFARDRVIGDSQVRIDAVYVAALELIDEDGRVGLGFVQRLVSPFAGSQARSFASSRKRSGPVLPVNRRLALVHRVQRPRGGNRRAFGLPFEEALQVALWDLSAKQAGLPLHRLLGGSATG